MAKRPANSAEESPERAQTRRLAQELFVRGFPALLMDSVRRAHPVEPNLILQLPDDGAALAPGLTEEGVRTVRTVAWIDLSDGPVAIHLPHMRGRYFSLTLIDAHGEAFASLGSRTGDDSGSDLVLVGSRWHGELQGGVKALRSRTQAVWAVSRITANSTADRNDTDFLAGRQGLAPRHGGRPAGRPIPLRLLEIPHYACVQQVLDMPSDTVVHRLNLLTERMLSVAADSDAEQIRRLLAQLRDAVAALDDAEASYAAVALGFADGRAAVQAHAASMDAPDASGWRWIGAGAAPGDTTPLDRAAWAYAELGSPIREDVLSLACEVDEAGRDLSGSERYRLHFARAATPPVEAFWSLYISPRSPAGGGFGPRRGISDRNDLIHNPDGSLDLMIQQDFPGGAAARNWLPSPPGPFTLHLRLHWPRAAALSGAWSAPAVERLGSGFARRTESRRQTPFPPHPPPPDELRPAFSAWR